MFNVKKEEMRKIERIFVHCTGGSQKTTVDGLLTEFRRKGWKNPGYHYVVTADGVIHKLLAEGRVSNGVKGYNATSINVAYTGGMDLVDDRTDAQKTSLRKLLVMLRKRYPDAVIMGHRDIWGSDPRKWKKACPCFDAKEEYGEL